MDELERAVFTGDAFGLCYPVLQTSGLFVFPSTSPTDFDPDEAHKAVDRIVATGAQRAFLTHFGELTQLTQAAGQLHRHLEKSHQWRDEAAASSLADDELVGFVAPRLVAHYQQCASERGLTWEGVTQQVMTLDADLNGQGIAHAARKKRSAAKAGSHG